MNRVISLACVALLALVASCGPGPAVEDPGGDCVAPAAGAWTGNGSCFGMEMTNTTDVDGCAMTFRDWNMVMSVPQGATIAGSAVTFTGDGWTDCTGTITEDGKTITGECSDGCALNLASDG